MKNLESKLSIFLNEDLGKLILRVSISILMLFHGWKKVVDGVDKIEANLVSIGLPEFIAYGVYLGEIVFPFLIILGLFTRLASIGVAFTMICAIFLVFSDKIFMLGKTGGPVTELPLLYLCTSIVIAFIGAGKYSLDYKMKISN